MLSEQTQARDLRMAFLKALPRTRELAHHDEHVTRHAVCTQPHTRHSGAHPHASVRNKRVPTSPEAERAQKLKGWMFPLPRGRSRNRPAPRVASLSYTWRFCKPPPETAQPGKAL